MNASIPVPNLPSVSASDVPGRVLASLVFVDLASRFWVPKPVPSSYDGVDFEEREPTRVEQATYDAALACLEKFFNQES